MTGIVVTIVPVAVIAGGLLLSGTRVWLGGIFAAGAGILAVVAGVLVPAWSAPQPPLIRAELDEVGVPAGWLQADESSDEGGCFDVCASVTRSYEVSGGPDEVLEELAQRFEDHGYDMAPVSFEGPARARSTTMTSSSGQRAAWYVGMDADSEAAPTVVSIYLKGAEG